MINDQIADRISQKMKTEAAISGAQPKAKRDQVQLDVARLGAQVQAMSAAFDTDAGQDILDKVREKVDKRIFEDGLDSYQRQIGVYSEAYAKRRIERGLSGGRVVLIWTGEMREAMYLEDGEEITIEFRGQFAEDKSRWVTKTYWTDIFELTDDEEAYMNELIDETADSLINGS